MIPHWGIYSTIQTVAETPTSMRQADKLFNGDEKRSGIGSGGPALKATRKEAK